MKVLQSVAMTFATPGLDHSHGDDLGSDLDFRDDGLVSITD